MSAALQEDVDVIGLSILSGAHNVIVPRVTELLRQNKMEDVLLLVGGIIPEQDFELLKKAGVDMNSPEPVRQACQLFGSYLGQMEELLG